MTEHNVAADAAFGLRFRHRIARAIAEKRKHITRYFVAGGCVVLAPGTWKRPEDWLSETADAAAKSLLSQCST